MDIIEKIAAFAQVTAVFYAWGMAFYATFRFVLKHYSLLTPVRIDGGLYTLMGMAGAAVLALQDNDVYKYLPPDFVFYAKTLSNILLAGAISLKTFRSRSYGDSADEQRRKSENTDMFRRPPTGT